MVSDDGAQFANDWGKACPFLAAGD